MSSHPLGSSWLPNIAAFLLAGCACSGLWLLMSQTQEQPRKEAEVEVLVRPLRLAPPPPPPQKQRSQKIQRIEIPSLSSSQSQSSVVLETTPLELPLLLEFDPKLLSESGSMDFEIDMEHELGAALKTQFEFEDMDEAPRLIHVGNFSFRFPKDLLRRNITKATVELSIEIHEDGQAKILGVVSAKYRQLVPIAKRMVSSAKFSVPKVDGKAVKVVGIWPVVLQAPR